MRIGLIQWLRDALSTELDNSELPELKAMVLLRQAKQKLRYAYNLRGRTNQKLQFDTRNEAILFGTYCKGAREALQGVQVLQQEIQVTAEETQKKIHAHLQKINGVGIIP